jgi:hypothetical protein
MLLIILSLTLATWINELAFALPNNILAPAFCYASLLFFIAEAYPLAIAFISEDIL